MLKKNGYERYACFLMSLTNLAHLDNFLILNKTLPTWTIFYKVHWYKTEAIDP